MNLAYLSADDWFAFCKLYPAAESFLLLRSLHGERKHLADVIARGHGNDWQRNRLRELDDWAESISKLCA